MNGGCFDGVGCENDRKRLATSTFIKARVRSEAVSRSKKLTAKAANVRHLSLPFSRQLDGVLCTSRKQRMREFLRIKINSVDGTSPWSLVFCSKQGNSKADCF
jgi:hypothetical protein